MSVGNCDTGVRDASDLGGDCGTVVVVCFDKFTDHYVRQYEIEPLDRLCRAVGWDIGMLVNPKFSRQISASRTRDKRVIVIRDWRRFGKALAELRDTPHPRAYLQVQAPTTVRGWIAHRLLASAVDYVVLCDNGGIPQRNTRRHDERCDLRVPILRGIGSVLRFVCRGEFRRAMKTLSRVAVRRLTQAFGPYPTHVLVAGEDALERNRDKWGDRAPDLVIGLPWDQSNSVAYGGSEEPPLRQPYAVLLDAPGPAHPSDVDFQGKRPVLTADRWYPALDSFFSRLEEEQGLEVVIAAHPRSLFPERAPEFGNRKVFYGRTEALIRHSELVLMRFSTAVAYAVMYCKPVVCIYNDQIRKDDQVHREIASIAAILDVPLVNVDAPPSDLSNLRNVPVAAYRRYRRRYLSASDESRPNHRRIVERLLGRGPHQHAARETLK